MSAKPTRGELEALAKTFRARAEANTKRWLSDSEFRKALRQPYRQRPANQD